MPRADFKFHYDKRARYAEIDAQAVVFNGRYLDYFDIGITEYFRAVGLFAHEKANGSADFHVAKAVVNFRAPIVLDEVVDICVRCSRIGTTSMTFVLEIHGTENGGDDLRADGEEISVHVSQSRGRPTPVPAAIIALFETFEGRRLRADAAA